MTFKILPHNLGSASARELATALGGVTRLRRTGSTYRPRPGHIIINWGVATMPDNLRGARRVLNSFDAVNRAGNKLAAFQAMPTEICVPFTTERRQAERWLRNDGAPVCVRHQLRGAAAEGLEVIEPGTAGVDIPNAPLYTRYIPKKEEYRVHVVNGEAVDIQKKILRPGTDPNGVNFRVRNLANGFVFVRNTAQPAPDVVSAAVQAVEALDLDFGAVDVIYNNKQRTAFVLEVNTAPGLEGQTVENYARAFERMAI